jgi:UDP-glucose 4-epimerase
MYDIACRLMGKQIQPQYAGDEHYWEKYPELFNGVYRIKDSILKDEINKYSLCDNSYAKEKYGWSPKVDIEEGLRRVIENECRLLEKIK